MALYSLYEGSADLHKQKPKKKGKKNEAETENTQTRRKLWKKFKQSNIFFEVANLH